MRVAIYTRISTDEDHQPYSPEAQDTQLGAYIASQDVRYLACALESRYLNGEIFDNVVSEAVSVQSGRGRGQDVEVISSFMRCVAVALDVPVADVPQPDAVGSDWKGQLRQWLARRHLGLVQLAGAATFNWPGY